MLKKKLGPVVRSGWTADPHTVRPPPPPRGAGAEETYGMPQKSGGRVRDGGGKTGRRTHGMPQKKRGNPRHARKKGGRDGMPKRGRDDGGKKKRRCTCTPERARGRHVLATVRAHRAQRKDDGVPRGRTVMPGKDWHAEQSNRQSGGHGHPARGREIPPKTGFFVFADSEFSLAKPEPLKTFS